MKGRVGSRIALMVIVVSLSSGAGCGGGGGGQNGNDNQPGETTPTPTRTAISHSTTTPERTATAERSTTPAETNTPGGSTPAATATPTGTTASVVFTVTTSAALGFQFTATYPTGKGSFVGSANGVNCTTASGGIFTKNDQDDGNLILSVANTSPFTFPIFIVCKFDVAGGQNLQAEDLGITAKEVTDVNGAVGDPDALTVVGAS
jgi:hypothetical protein